MIWKIRAVKSYPEAHNHLLVGEVRRSDDVSIELHCRTYHFGRSVNKIGDIRVSTPDVRIIPWNRVEVVRVLDDHFDYRNAKLETDKHGSIRLTDGRHECSILSANHPPRY